MIELINHIMSLDMVGSVLSDTIAVYIVHHWLKR